MLEGNNMGIKSLIGIHVLPFTRVSNQIMFGLKGCEMPDECLVDVKRTQDTIFGGGKEMDELPFQTLHRELNEEHGNFYYQSIVDNSKERFVIVKKTYNDRGFLINFKTRCIHVNVENIEWDTELVNPMGVTTLSIVGLLQVKIDKPGPATFYSAEGAIDRLVEYHKSLFMACLPYVISPGGQQAWRVR